MLKPVPSAILFALVTLGFTPVGQASTTYVFRQFIDGDGQAAPCSVTGSWTESKPGIYNETLPANCTITATLAGAGGGFSNAGAPSTPSGDIGFGGNGGYGQVQFRTGSSPLTVQVLVGGPGTPIGGGGLSAIWKNSSPSLSTLLAVVGGGGGAGWVAPNQNGGAGGGPNQAGTAGQGSGYGGGGSLTTGGLSGGGSQAGGFGFGGGGTSTSSGDGTSFGAGGTCGGTNYCGGYGGGGSEEGESDGAGGGSGFYGGGGGSIADKASGGGGSGFAASSVTVLSAKVGGGGAGGTSLSVPAQPGSVSLSW